MKKSIKKLITAITTAVILTTTFSFSVSAESPSPETVLTKAQFANLHSAEYDSTLINIKR